MDPREVNFTDETAPSFTVYMPSAPNPPPPVNKRYPLDAVQPVPAPPFAILIEISVAGLQSYGKMMLGVDLYSLPPWLTTGAEHCPSIPTPKTPPAFPIVNQNDLLPGGPEQLHLKFTDRTDRPPPTKTS